MRALLLLCLLAATSAAQKVLLYSPRFGGSHVSFMGGVADTLVKEGMDVTVLLPKMNKWIHSNGTRLAKTLTVEADPRVTAMLDDNVALARVWEAETGPWAALGLLGVVTRAHTFQCEKNLAETELLEFLKKEKFDLGISEVFDACGLAIFDEIGLEKHVIMQTALLPEKVAQAFGIPNLPSLVPAYYSDAPMEMGYAQRALNLVRSFFGNWWNEWTMENVATAAERVLGRRIDLEKKLSEAIFVFTNTDSLLDFPRPVTERLVNVGGLSVPEPKPLDAFWTEVVSRRKTTVLVSFGSVAQSVSMPLEMKKAVLATFRRFPEVTFVWKYEEEDAALAKEAPNVVLHRWVPQNDLLAHPNLRLFVTHAGMNSILESTRRGVPMVTVPLFGDQMRNAQMVRRFGNSEFLEKGDLLNEDVLERTIRALLEDESYRQNASRLSRMMAARPRNQRDELVKHVRFAAEFGSLPEYRIPQVSFLQYYMLDILVPLFAVCMFLLVTVVYLTLFLVRRILRPNKLKNA